MVNKLQEALTVLGTDVNLPQIVCCWLLRKSNRSMMDESGLDQSGLDQSGLDQSGLDQSGLDQVVWNGLDDSAHGM
jgi:hypothetical protein